MTDCNCSRKGLTGPRRSIGKLLKPALLLKVPPLKSQPHRSSGTWRWLVYIDSKTNVRTICTWRILEHHMLLDPGAMQECRKSVFLNDAKKTSIWLFFFLNKKDIFLSFFSSSGTKTNHSTCQSSQWLVELGITVSEYKFHLALALLSPDPKSPVQTDCCLHCITVLHNLSAQFLKELYHGVLIMQCRNLWHSCSLPEIGNVSGTSKQQTDKHWQLGLH